MADDSFKKAERVHPCLAYVIYMGAFFGSTYLWWRLSKSWDLGFISFILWVPFTGFCTYITSILFVLVSSVLVPDEEPEPPKKAPPLTPDIRDVLERAIGPDRAWVSEENYNAFVKSLDAAGIAIVATISAYLWKVDNEAKDKAFKKALMLWFTINKGDGTIKEVSNAKVTKAFEWVTATGEQAVLWGYECAEAGKASQQ